MTDPLQALKVRFLERCTRDLTLIEQALKDPATTADPKFAEVVHKLSGAAGSFGFDAISELAGRVDDELMDGETPSKEALQALAEGLRAL